ncbi:MAG: aquaporin [Ruminococcaceae bacterium]|nr:aquaporin [Oscillospiraceae bacterium]
MKLRFKKYFAELIGTAMLVLFGCGTGMAVGTDYKKGTGYLLTAFAFGLVFIAMYYSLSRISGCHLNPAVSFSMLMTRNMDIWDFIGYTVAQIAGAFGGCGLLTFIFWGHTGNYSANTYYDAAFYSTFVIELLMCMVLVTVFLGTYKSKAAFGGIVNGLAIVLVHVFSIQLTGGSANPARTIATAVFAGGDYLSEAWIIMAGAMVGAIIGGLLHMLLSSDKEDGINEEGEASLENGNADEEINSSDKSENGTTAE